MTTVIPEPPDLPEAQARRKETMPIRTRLPELEHWKAQVKCQAGCPVATDAGRYVQLIAEGQHEDACRRGAIDAPITIRALKRYVTERYGVESRRPDTQDRLRQELVSEGNRYAGHLPVSANGH